MTVKYYELFLIKGYFCKFNKIGKSFHVYKRTQEIKYNHLTQSVLSYKLCKHIKKMISQKTKQHQQ